MNPLYNITIFGLIMGNTITLAVDGYPQSFDKETTLVALNDFFTWAFTAEMLLKMTALGFKNYMRDRFNMFDCIVVLFSLIDFTMGLVSSGSGGSFLQAFRALRLLRVVKVVRRWKKLQEIISKIMLSLNDIMNFSVLLFLFLYIYSLLGMELFANRAYYTDTSFNIAVPADKIVEVIASG
jgi:voltage-dependent calcium channel L type alpha-1D